MFKNNWLQQYDFAINRTKVELKLNHCKITFANGDYQSYQSGIEINY